MLVKHQMHWIPWTKSTPVFNANCEVAACGGEPGSDPIIHGTAAFDSGENQYQTAVKSLC
jgi:hypothetical protein